MYFITNDILKHMLQKCYMSNKTYLLNLFF